MKEFNVTVVSSAIGEEAGLRETGEALKNGALIVGGAATRVIMGGLGLVGGAALGGIVGVVTGGATGLAAGWLTPEMVDGLKAGEKPLDAFVAAPERLQAKRDMAKIQREARRQAEQIFAETRKQLREVERAARSTTIDEVEAAKKASTLKQAADLIEAAQRAAAPPATAAT